MKKVFSILGTLLLFGMVSMFCSCGSDELSEMDVPQQESAGWNHAKVKLNIECTGFDQKDGTTRAAGDQWQDGDVVYILLTDKDGNKVQAYVKYDGSKQEWGDVIYDGYKSYLTCSTERVAEAYYIEGVSALGSSTLNFGNDKAVYACTDGSYVYPADGDMTLSVGLKPLTGRIRFEGKANAIASVSGIKTYTAFSTVTGKFTESTAAVNTKVAADGSTPYIYSVFANASEPSLTVVTDKTYKTVFDASATILKPGKSGFMSLPTADDHRGWKTIVAVTGVTLNKTSLSLQKGNTETLTVTVSPADATDKTVGWSSSNTSVCTVDNNGKVTAIAVGSATITAASKTDASKKATCTVNVIDANGHAFVDLGLTSGTKWANMNVGATSESDYGSYFAWGETTTKSSYSSSNYTYQSNPTTLPLDKDAARANWGGSWKMPTKEQFSELSSECTWTWTTIGGKSGYKVSSKKNTNYIFLPAAGYYGSSVGNAGSYGYYWSSSPYTSDTSVAYALSCSSSNINPTNDFYRYIGRSVRPVLSE